MVCPHALLVRGLCVACGEEVDDVQIVEFDAPAFTFLVPGMRVHHAASFAEDDGRRVAEARKLYLILGLDGVLVHAICDGPPLHATYVDAAGSIESDGQSVEMVVTSTGEALLLRPHLLRFLRQMSELFKISLYTKGDWNFGRAVCSAIDPSNAYVCGGVFTSESPWIAGLSRSGKKDLAHVACQRDMALVVDSTADGWTQDWGSLCLIPPWTGEPTDDALLLIADQLSALHEAAFLNVSYHLRSSPNVRDELARMRPRFLEGCVLVLCGVIPLGCDLADQVVCRLVVACGRTVEAELSERTTHLVFRTPDSEMILRAQEMQDAGLSTLEVVWEIWLLASLAFWCKLPVGRMALEFRVSLPSTLASGTEDESRGHHTHGGGGGGQQAFQSASLAPAEDIAGGIASSRAHALLDAIWAGASAEVDNLSFDFAVETPALKTPLLKHQEQGVAWMIQRERASNSLPPFVELHPTRPGVFVNKLTGTTTRSRPPAMLGGILADDMWLGKTIQMIALILARPRPGVGSFRLGAHFAGDAEGSELTAGGTLLVVPSSTISSWQRELDTHVKPATLVVYTYHGKGRSTLALAGADVVITTYDMVRLDFESSTVRHNEEQPGGGAGGAGATGLLSLNWHRVVLDEAHQIKDRRTGKFMACAALEATHRWCVSGTPLQNKVDDSHSLVVFLRFEPFVNVRTWRSSIGNPVACENTLGLSHLHMLMSAIALRRKKESIELHGAFALPPKTTEIVMLELGTSARSAYEALFESSSLCYSLLVDAGGETAVRHNYFGILELIVRLRQLCDSVALLPESRIAAAYRMLAEYEERRARAAAAGVPMTRLSVDEASALLARLRASLDGSEMLDCPVCMLEVETGDVRAVRGCKHALCCNCIEELFTREPSGRPPCPLCRANFGREDVLAYCSVEHDVQLAAAASDQVGGTVEADTAANGLVAACRAEQPVKIRALLDALERTRAETPEVRSVVFSQWTGFLDIVQSALLESRFTTCRIDGSMSARQRDAAIADFSQQSGGPEVMLVSLKAGGVGINLTRASQCFLLDMWWNAAVDQQAIDRIHRIGQTRAVSVVKFVCARTIEEEIIQLQQSKTGLASDMFARSRKELSRERLKQFTNLLRRSASTDVDEWRSTDE